MTTPFRVEKGVPIPEPFLKYPFAEMQVGDSFFVPGGDVRNRLSVAISAWKKSHPGDDFTTRKGAVAGDRTELVQGFRVWRTK